MSAPSSMSQSPNCNQALPHRYDRCFWAPRSRPGCIDTGYTFRVDIGAGDAHVVSPPVPGRAGASYQALLERLPSGRWAAHGTDGNNIGQLSPSLTAGEATGVEFKWESAQSLVWTRDVVGNSQDTCRPLGSKDNEQRPAHGHDQPNGLRDLLDVFPMKDEVDLVDAVLKAESLSLPSVSQPVLKNRGTLYMVGDSTTLQWFGQVKQIHVSREICSAVDMGGKGSTRNMTAMDGFAEMKYVRYRIGGRPRIQEREETAESASKSESESLSTLFEQALHTVSRKEASALARAAQSQTQTWLGSVVNRCVCIMPLPASLRLIGSQAEHATSLALAEWVADAKPTKNDVIAINVGLHLVRLVDTGGYFALLRDIQEILSPLLTPVVWILSTPSPRHVFTPNYVDTWSIKVFEMIRFMNTDRVREFNLLATHVAKEYAAAIFDPFYPVLSFPKGILPSDSRATDSGHPWEKLLTSLVPSLEKAVCLAHAGSR
eukprot:scaffold1900_cov389-Prasinococcus_capsulatus_cf.AAC.10